MIVLNDCGYRFPGMRNLTFMASPSVDTLDRPNHEQNFLDGQSKAADGYLIQRTLKWPIALQLSGPLWLTARTRQKT
jgi:hypothetical protein